MKGVCQFYVNTYNRRRYYIELKVIKAKEKEKLSHRGRKMGDNLTHEEKIRGKECQNVPIRYF